jgi:hypothetical protein
MEYCFISKLRFLGENSKWGWQATMGSNIYFRGTGLEVFRRYDLWHQGGFTYRQEKAGGKVKFRHSPKI